MNVIDNTTHLNNQQEEWRKVVGFERFYSVSSLGRVRSDIQRNHRPHGRILSQSLKKTGYLQICLSMNGKHFYYNVHTLVTEAFIGPRPADFQVNHLNGIKTDNRRENLEYVTRSENSQHALKLGLRKRGEAHVNAKLKESDVREILRLHSDGNNTLKEIGDMFDIQPTQVFKIVTGETWAHVGAETRARAAVWATAMLTGAVIGIIIYLISPAIIRAFIGSGTRVGSGLGTGSDPCAFQSI